MYHRTVKHDAIKDCWAFRNLFNHKIAKGELEVPDREKGVDKDPLPKNDRGKWVMMILITMRCTKLPTICTNLRTLRVKQRISI